jgi:hypothetical protein
MAEILIWTLVILAFGAYFVGVYHVLSEKDRIGYRNMIEEHQKRLDSDVKL